MQLLLLTTDLCFPSSDHTSGDTVKNRAKFTQGPNPGVCLKQAKNAPSGNAQFPAKAFESLPRIHAPFAYPHPALR